MEKISKIYFFEIFFIIIVGALNPRTFSILTFKIWKPEVGQISISGTKKRLISSKLSFPAIPPRPISFVISKISKNV